MTNGKQVCRTLFGLVIYLAVCPCLHTEDAPEESDIVCRSHTSKAECILGQRYSLSVGSFESRGAGDVEGHPMISLGRGGMGKFVGNAMDLIRNETVFVKCRPREGGEGAVADLASWREVEAERAVHGHPNVLCSVRRMPMRGGGECAIFPLAGGSLTDRLSSATKNRRVKAGEIETALVHVLRGIAALHRSGYVHRDIKVSASFQMNFNCSCLHHTPSWKGMLKQATIFHLLDV
jgi:hypothetical protein